MNKSEAHRLLNYHSCQSMDIDHPKWRTGFLGSLVPFKGILYESNFIEIMECLECLKEDFLTNSLEHNLMKEIFAIIHLGRSWTEKGKHFDPYALLSDEQADLIYQWIFIIEDTVYHLLDGNIDEAFWRYKKYCTEKNGIKNQVRATIIS